MTRSGLRGRFVAAGAVAVLSVATLVALVAVPAGQDGGTVALSTGPGGKAVNAAYAATAETGTARGLLTVTDGSSTVTATGVGAFDGSKAEGEIALVGGPAGPGGAGGTTRITVVRTGSAIYAKLPAGSNPLSTDKPWVSVDAATLNRLTALALGDLGSQVTAAPLDALAYLKAFSGDVQVVGPDTVRGEATTRYRGTVDAQRVAQQLPAGAGPDAGRAAREVGSVPADLWIDGQGRLRKLVLTVDGSKLEGAPATAPIGIATVTLELWDFGTPVDASAPPADQVVDVGGLVGSFLNGVGGP